MSKASRDKGARAERELVSLHGVIGVKAERVPLSGASRYQGNGSDVDVDSFGPDAAPLVSEVKARASGEGFTTIERLARQERSVVPTPEPGAAVGGAYLVDFGLG